MAATGRAVRSNSKTTGMNADVEVWQPRDKVGFDFDSVSSFKDDFIFITCMRGSRGGWGQGVRTPLQSYSPLFIISFYFSYCGPIKACEQDYADCLS